MKLNERTKQLEIITRYFEGLVTPEETAGLFEWIDASKDNRMYFQELKNIWDNSGHLKNIEIIDTDEALKSVRQKITLKSPLANFWDRWKNIAAILLIPLILGNILFLAFQKDKDTLKKEPVYNELFVTFGTRSALKLSDGSSVWLNSGSSLRYPDRFAEDKRTVFLSGEAYFEVESNPNHPFIVETTGMNVKATGTKFNVAAYSSDDKAEVTLVAGQVEIIMRDDTMNNVTSYVLNKNQHLSYQKSSKNALLTDVETDRYIAWKDGKMIFMYEPLNEAIKKIGQVFNVDIELQGSSIQEYSLRAIFEDESLEEILKMLKISSPIDYKEVKRTHLPDGSFTKKKIIIYPSGTNTIK